MDSDLDLLSNLFLNNLITAEQRDMCIVSYKFSIPFYSIIFFITNGSKSWNQFKSAPDHFHLILFSFQIGTLI